MIAVREQQISIRARLAGQFEIHSDLESNKELKNIHEFNIPIKKNFLNQKFLCFIRRGLYFNLHVFMAFSVVSR